LADAVNDPSDPASGPALDEFTALCERCQGHLSAFLRGIVGDDELARDLARDTLLAAWRVARNGTPPFTAGHDDDERRRWLFHVAYRRAVSALCHRRVIHWGSLDALMGEHARASEAHPSLTGFEDRVAESHALRAALAALAPRDAACVVLIVVCGFTAAETGAIVGASARAVAKRFARAKLRLRDVYLAQSAQLPERSRP
jgi:RNA polymerase sigma factor (sigma-70 family)